LTAREDGVWARAGRNCEQGEGRLSGNRKSVREQEALLCRQNRVRERQLRNPSGDGSVTNGKARRKGKRRSTSIARWCRRGRRTGDKKKQASLVGNVNGVGGWQGGEGHQDGCGAGYLKQRKQRREEREPTDPKKNRKKNQNQRLPITPTPTQTSKGTSTPPDKKNSRPQRGKERESQG